MNPHIPSCANSVLFRCRTNVAAVCVILLLSVAVRAASNKPIQVSPETTRPLTVSKILYKPNGEYSVSFAPEAFAITLTETLRKFGYNALGYENLMFGVDKSGAAQVALGGDHREVRLRCFPAYDW